MNERSNVVTASLERGRTTVTTRRLWQYDYGMKLRLENIDLPESYEVHFSNSASGEAVTAVGGGGEVGIPDRVLTTGEPVHAWLYLHTGEEDGETVYHIIIPVFPRPAPGDGEPTPAEQSALTQAMALLRTGIGRAEDAAEDAEAASRAVQDLTVEARTLDTGAQATAVKTVGQDGRVTISFGLPRGAKGDAGDLPWEDLEEMLASKAEIDGVYAGMTVGRADNLAVTGKDGNTVPPMTADRTPYCFRTAGGSADIGDRAYEAIVGGTIVWNQLVGSGTTEVTLPGGHTYIACTGGTWTCALSAGTAISVTGGTDQVFDLTQMFGTAIAGYVYGLEQAAAGAGTAWFRRLFPKDCYAYDAGSLQSVRAASHDMVGFNAYDHSTGKAVLLGGNQYQITGAYTSLAYEDINRDSETITPDADGLFTPVNNGTLTVTGGDGATTCVHLAWSGCRSGAYEAYVRRSYPLDSSLTLHGIPRLDAGNGLYYDGDLYESDGTVTRRYEKRPYQSGDEGLADAVTDGTNTVVRLAVPAAGTAAPFQSPQVVDDFGTEAYADAGVQAGTRDVAVPVGHATRYPADLRDKLRRLPEPADGDGRYVIVQDGRHMTLTADTSPGRLTALESGKQSKIASGSIAFSAAWSGSGPYTQSVTVTGAVVTSGSRIDLQPTAVQLAALQTDGVTALVVENNAGTLTAYALGAAPSAAMTVQCTVTEVTV